MHRPSPFLQPLQKNTYHLPCSPLPLHRILSPSQPLQKDNNPSPRTKLASLVKGRWLDGKAQTVALLRFTCNTSAFLFTKLLCRQDGGIAIPPFNQHHIYASLVKGEVLSPEKNRATTGGIATPLSLASHQPSRTRTIPRLAPHSCHMNALLVSHPCETLGVQLRASMPVPCQRGLDCDKAISYYKLQHSAISSTLIFAQPYLSQD